MNTSRQLSAFQEDLRIHKLGQTQLLLPSLIEQVRMKKLLSIQLSLFSVIAEPEGEATNLDAQLHIWSEAVYW